eukprot:575443-Pleurochrysis_carterae.AAC.1
MPLYDSFATSVVAGKLPSWFYMLWTSSMLTPLIKALPAQLAADPDVRSWLLERLTCVPSRAP